MVMQGIPMQDFSCGKCIFCRVAKNKRWPQTLSRLQRSTQWQSKGRRLPITRHGENFPQRARSQVLRKKMISQILPSNRTWRWGKISAHNQHTTGAVRDESAFSRVEKLFLDLSNCNENTLKEIKGLIIFQDGLFVDGTSREQNKKRMSAIIRDLEKKSNYQWQQVKLEITHNCFAFMLFSFSWCNQAWW